MSLKSITFIKSKHFLQLASITMAAKKMTSDDMKSHFNTNASLYEKLTGGTTRRIAEGFMHHLPPLTSSTRIIDSACGPGIVTQLILEKAKEQRISPPPYVLGIDNAQGMIDQFEGKKETFGWTTVESRVMSAETLTGIEDNSFDAVIMNFGLFALPDAVKGAAEMWRVLKTGGVAIITTWKRSPPVDILEKAVGAIRPTEKDSVFPISKDWLKAEKLSQVMTHGGFESVKVDSFDSYWKNDSLEEFLESLTGPFWQRLWAHWSDEEKARLKPEILNALTEEEKGSEGTLDMIAWVCVAHKGVKSESL
jgi:ubiquinone/menaquinone biosynthesis C-methylase UbiE